MKHPGDISWATNEETLMKWFHSIEDWAEESSDWEGKVAETNHQLGLQILHHLLLIEQHLESVS